ncbi:MAG: hypothetical protein KAJ65_06735 [Gammaproteobacteria bacterium]|jgi:hypothetical protein|nr:hypothetical protein [Gammaproteobacteria bacterium]
MDEQEYRKTYHSVNDRRCVFEKTINSRCCTCEKSCRFHLADREGIACKSATANALCKELLGQMRSNARFALHLTSADAPLPHAKEIKVQTGGLLGLQNLLHPEKSDADTVENAIGLIDTAITKFGRLEDLPYDIIVQAIVKFEGRKKRSRKHDH